jgi:ABC-2 type transport system ATP-binding protein
LRYNPHRSGLFTATVFLTDLQRKKTSGLFLKPHNWLLLFQIFVMSIEVQHISKNYGTQKALNNLSFSIKKGEIVGFLGPNGAGKSTLMKILTTYLSADQGTALVNGFEVSTQQLQVQQSIGYLPEHNPLYLDLYVREYLAYQAEVYKVDKSRIAAVIELTGLQKEAHKKIGQLSKGYRQRVGLASALLHDPAVLILDEPTTGLDPNQLVDIRAVIKAVGKNKTVLLSTHIMQEVEALCDRVIIINEGELVADKKIDAVVAAQKQQLIEVEFDQAVSAELLETIPHLIAKLHTGGNGWELTFSSENDVRTDVFDFAQANGLKTLQINLKNKNLETVFHELTQK